MNKFFPEMKKKLAFGCMRLPTINDQIDFETVNKMVDCFLEQGFNYFDTARPYHDGQSEVAVGRCLADRHPRESFLLADKLSFWLFERKEQIVELFESQLAACHVDYFDFYLLHALNKRRFESIKELGIVDICLKLKEQGKIKHLGFSFHDTADVLDKILTEQPFMEAVQLQFNYLDYDDPTVQSRACYDVAVKHGKKVIVMEPVKGGALVNLPDKAARVFETLGGGSQASYALRFAASFPEVFMVLSGMGNMEMLNDNISSFSDFKSFTEAEFKATDRVREIIREVRQIPCTGCRYCTEVCPKNISIPDIFSAYNKYLAAKITKAEAKDSFPKEHPATECIKCGKCEKNCPQNIDIRGQLEEISK